MRRESAKNRELWTALIEGRAAKKPSKYHNQDNRKSGGYQSKREAEVAVRLHALARSGDIHDLREQVPVVLVKGRDGVRDITWVADFVYRDDAGLHHCDAKGMQTAVFRLKKKLAYLLCGIVIELL